MRHIDDKKIGDILVREAYVTEEELTDAKKQAQERNRALAEHLLLEKVLTPDLLGQAIAESFGVSYADLNSHQPSKEQVLKVPEEIAQRYHAVLFREDDARVVVTTDDPKHEGLLTDLKTIFPKRKIEIAYSLDSDIDKTLVAYRKTLEARFVTILEKSGKVAPEIIDEILDDALLYRASDVHFEPRGNEVVIRFRIDGVLVEAGRFQKEHYENVLNRFKVRAQLRIDEHNKTQDGALRVEREDGVVDIRISIAPALDGEKIVLRILSKHIQSFTLSDLGLSGEAHEAFSEASKKPFGMILVTGPTGSGKTTSLYAALKLLNTPEVNITTIEDPVEYRVTGINQIQVNNDAEITFAKGLRSIVRQDPDIILVGEIRDPETAEIAVNAALTGHLLLSTFHANDSATAVPRLLDMGIEPFLLSSTLELLMAQRLVRRLCESCRYSVSLSKKELTDIFETASHYFTGTKTTLYRGRGCASCGGSGYKGQIGIFEYIKVTPEMKELIQSNPSTQDVWKLARKQGARALFGDGIDKVKGGVTSIEELLRVASPEART